MTLTVALEPDPDERRRVQRHLTTRLPEWFDQTGSSVRYAAQAERLPGFVARLDGEPRGLLLLKPHGGSTAEIYWLGVDPNCHRSGVGRALVDAACDAARAENRDLLFVWTLDPSVDYEPYARTRRFYEAMGFRYVLLEHVPDERNPLGLYMRRLAD